LGLLERAMGVRVFATWDQAGLMEASTISARGAADAQRLGIRPQRKAAVLGLGDAKTVFWDSSALRGRCGAPGITAHDRT
jgi:hypothetical protein